MILFSYLFIAIILISAFKAFVFKKTLFPEWKKAIVISLILTSTSTIVALSLIWGGQKDVPSNFFEILCGYLLISLVVEFFIFYFILKRRSSKDYLICTMAYLGSIFSVVLIVFVFILSSDFYLRYRHESNLSEWNTSSLLNDLDGYIVFKARGRFQEYNVYSLKERKIIQSFVILKPIEKSCIESFDLNIADPESKFNIGFKGRCLDIAHEIFQIPNTNKFLSAEGFSLGFYRSHYLILSNLTDLKERFLITSKMDSNRFLFLNSLKSK